MIRHLRHGDIDKVAWDRALMRCPDRLWYAQSWLLDLCCPAWEALVGDDGSIMPLIWRRKFGIDYLYQPYAVQQQGVFSPQRGKDTDDAFLAAVPPRFRYWNIHLNQAMQVHPGSDMRIAENSTQLLRLDGDPATLRAAYSKGHRRSLRKAGDAPREISRDVAVKEFIALFERTTGKRFGNIPAGGLLLLERSMEEAVERGQCALWGMRSAGRPIAAACFMEWEGRSIFLKSANDAEGLEQQAMFHITDAYIADRAGTGILLDFAGSNTPSTARFNTGFGAGSTIYLHLVRNRLPAPLRWFKR